MSEADPKKTRPSGKPAERVDLETAIRRKVIARDPRFSLAAYLFMYEALAFTQKSLDRDDPNLDATQRHVSGRELVEGIRQYAAQLFGPLAPTVFRNWGVQTTADFGQIVFNLVNANLLGKTEEDCLEDFAEGFNFDTAFDGPINVTLQ